VYPNITGAEILDILVGGSVIGLLGFGMTFLVGRRTAGAIQEPAIDIALRPTWRMPPLSQLSRPKMSLTRQIWMGVLRGYLLIAAGMVVFEIGSLALGHG
jgi:hypothetical protein